MDHDVDRDEIERPGLLTRLALAALAFLASLLFAVIANSPAARATCGNDCNPDPVDYYSTLTVTRPAVGSVTSDLVGENQINCPATGGGTCSVTDVRTVVGARPTAGWPVYSLTATGPVGYAYDWTAPCVGAGSTCSVTNKSEQGITVGGMFRDVQPPAAPTLNAPAFVNGGTPISASGTDNAGVVSFDWTACTTTQCVPFASHAASITLGSLWADSWTVHVRAVDGAGNLSTEVTSAVELDPSAPSVHVTAPAMYTNVHGPDVDITFTATDPNLASTTCAVDGGQPVACDGPNWTATGMSANQTHTITVAAADKAGNVGSDHVLVTATPIAMTLAVHPNALGPFMAFSATGIPQTATASVHFHTGNGVDICTAPVQNGTTMCIGDPTVLAGADHEVVGDYSGDVHLFAATAQLDVETTVHGFSFTAAPNAATLAYGTKHGLVMNGAPSDLTGTVTFDAAGKTLCSATVSGGGATCAAGQWSLTPGSHTVTAVASGDPNYVPETTTFPVVITRGAPKLSERLSAASVHKGQSITATVSGVPANGSVTFQIGTKKICTVRATSGRASCATPKTLTAHSYQLVAKYAGNALWKPASATVGFTVVR